MRIRPAERGDAKALWALYHAFIIAMQAFEPEDETEDTQLLEWIEGGVAGVHSQIWVADTGDQLAGFARVSEKRRDDTPENQRYAKLNDLFVVPGERHRGLATELMHQAHAWAMDRRLPNIVLNVYQDNMPARLLYEHMEYRKLRDIARGRLMMIKNLAPSH